MVAWCTRLSTAANVMAGSGKIVFHSPNGWFAVMSIDLRLPCADEFKQHARFGLIFGDVSDVIEDEQVEFV